MSKWGKIDQSVTVTTSTTVESTTGAPIGTYALVKSGGGDSSHQGNTNGTRANADKTMFGNTTVGAFIPGMATGIFGINSAETGVTSGNIAFAYVTSPGSGYAANAAVAITVTNGGTSGVVNANANSCGRIAAVKIQVAGSGYKTNPTIAIAAPAAVTFNGVSGISLADDSIIISTANSKFLAGDRVLYKSTTGAVITPLANNTYYYIQGANTTAVLLSTTVGGSPIDFTANGSNDTGHSLQGETATGYVTVGGAINRGVSHAGWVLRTEGTGGRAGRVQYETLVAMGGDISGDASDDEILPDSN